MNVNTMVQRSGFSEIRVKIKERDNGYRGVKELRYILDVFRPECHSHHAYYPYKLYPDSILH